MSGRHPSHSSAESSRDHARARAWRARPSSPAAGNAAAQRALIWALALTGGFAVVEAVGGWWSGSLALLSDAGHMVTDAAALGLALFALRIAARPPSRARRTATRAPRCIAAFVNALALLALVVFIVVEAVQPAARARAGRRRRGAGDRAVRPRRQPRHGVDPVARDAHAQHARRAAARAVATCSAPPRRSSRAR